MARPREFDADLVTDRALDLFWREGYQRTSLADLERETGVGRKGLYNTFGSKHGLFLEVLKRYEERTLEQIQAPLESAGAGRAEIEQAFETIMSLVGPTHRNRGCLICLTAESEVTRSAEVSQRVQACLQRLRNSFVSALRGARTAGDIAADKNPEVLADFFIGALMGLSAMTRAGRPRTQIKHYIDTALATLD
jgi:TetR/AcrR family transcriptional repressor of nem operon